MVFNKLDLVHFDLRRILARNPSWKNVGVEEECEQTNWWRNCNDEDMSYREWVWFKSPQNKPIEKIIQILLIFLAFPVHFLLTSWLFYLYYNTADGISPKIKEMSLELPTLVWVDRLLSGQQADKNIFIFGQPLDKFCLKCFLAWLFNRR